MLVRQSKQLRPLAAALVFSGIRLLAQGVTGSDPQAACVALQPGLVVESVAKDSEAEKAGVKEGDVLLAWVQGDHTAGLSSPFELTGAEPQISSRGATAIEGTSGPAKRRWSLGPDVWGIKARPQLPEDILRTYLKGRDMAKAGNTADAAERWRAAAADAGKIECRWLPAWLIFNAAETFAEKRQWADADTYYRQSLALAAKTTPAIRAQILLEWAATLAQRNDWAGAEKPYQEALREARQSGTDSLLLARALSGLGKVADSRGEGPAAETFYLQALAIREKLAPASLDVAESLTNLGSIAAAGGSLDRAEEYHRKALAIRERLLPGSMAVAGSLNSLGVIEADRGSCAKAQERLRQALVIREKLAPDSLAVAASLNNLGGVANNCGDLDKAEEYHRRALAIRQKLAPGSLSVAGSLGNLGLVAYSRRDLAKAESYYRESLAINAKLAPESFRSAFGMNNLGLVLHDRGDLAGAEEYHRHALAIWEKLAPEGRDVAAALNNLGNIAKERGDPSKAESYYLRSAAILEKTAPGSHDLADSIGNLGALAQDRGDLQKADEYFRQALAIFEKLTPGGPHTAETYNSLGESARRRKDLAGAETYYRRALEIRQKLAPESLDTAETLAGLAAVMRDNGQPAAAADLFAASLDALEGQTAHLGGSNELRSGYRARNVSYYKEYLDLLMSRKQPDLAFEVLERSRARTLLETLGEAHVDIRQGADPSLLEQERSLQLGIRAKTNRRIALAETGQTEQKAAVDKELEALLAQYGDVEGRIRTTSPGYMALTQPTPISVKVAQQQLLDAGTVLLEYALGDERSYVFVLTNKSLDAFELPKRDDIEGAARQVHDRLASYNGRVGNESEELRKKRLVDVNAGYLTAVSKLSAMVLGPVVSRLGDKRLIIVSDGALQYIPFAVLPVAEPSTAAGRRTQPALPLVATHEIVDLPSASVLAVLRQDRAGRPETAAKTVAVLADPVFDKDDARVLRAKNTAAQASADPQVAANLPGEDRLTRSASDAGFRNAEGPFLPRLAFSRQEAAAIAALAGKDRALEAIDFQASRETATSPELAQYRIVHFATHGLLDSKHPELSGLVLSLVDEQGNPRNGFLDLADIYNLKLSADLVVLSACETALGKQISGEGLVGLTRGFMYAGAPRVIASLWKVDDVATSELMERFYRGMLKEGKRPAAALRQAQLEMWRQKRWEAPYYWGAFTLQGEWK